MPNAMRCRRTTPEASVQYIRQSRCSSTSAWAWGRVGVIATPVGGIVDFLKDPSTGSGQANGLFCEPGNPKDIAEKIKILIQDKLLAQKLIQNGLNLVKNEYNWDIISQKIKNLYSEIIIKK